MRSKSAAKKRVLIVDDSVVFRTFFRGCISQIAQVEVIGIAKDGRDALSKIKALKPDLVTMDMEMPHFSGIEVLESLQHDAPDVAVLVVSSESETDADKTIQALEAGAFDFIVKPSSSERDPGGVLLKMLRESIPRARSVSVVTQSKGRMGRGSSISARTLMATPAREVRSAPFSPDVVAMGSSTGGPAALHKVLSMLPVNFPVPITVTQHMPKLFLQSLADRLSRDTPLSAKVAEDGMVFEKGCIYVAPGDIHMEVERMGSKLSARLVDGPKVHHCKPAVDVTFRSLAALAPRVKCLAVVLTGMGADGAAGAKAMKEKGAYVIAQDEASSVVWGMPGETVKCGAADVVLPLDEIAGALIKCCGR